MDFVGRPGWGEQEVRQYAVVLVLVEVVFAFFVGVVVHYGNPSGRGIFVGGLLIAGGLVAWAVAPTLRAKRAARGSVVVSGDGVVIDEPGVLTTPLRVPAHEVRAIMVDGAGGDSDLGGMFGRFPIRRGISAWSPGVASSELVGYLYTTDGGSVIPFIGRRDEHPNLALLFERPIPLPRLRRMSSLSFVGYAPAGQASDGNAVPGLLMRVADPHAARTALEALGVHRGLTEHDLRDVTAVEPMVRRAISTSGLIRLGLLLFVLYRMAIVAHVMS